MGAPVQEAAAVLVPLLSAGAEAAAYDLAKQAGSRFYAAASKVVGSIRGYIAGSNPDVTEVEDALRSALADGKLVEEDLRTLVSLTHAGRDNVSIQAEGNIYSGNSITVKRGDFIG